MRPVEVVSQASQLQQNPPIIDKQKTIYLLVGDGRVADEVEAVGDGLQILLHNDLRARQRAAEQTC